MTTLVSRVQRAYSLFVSICNSLQSPLLLFVRVYWGWQFMVDGWGKLTHLPKVIEYFGSLGLPAPGPNRVLRIDSRIGRRRLARARTWKLVSSPCC